MAINFEIEWPSQPALAETCPAKTNLMDLPTELLTEIIECLIPSEFTSRHEIQSAIDISLVNKRMHALIDHRFNLYEFYDTRTGIPYLFLRTVMTNPEAAAKVQNLCSVDNSVPFSQLHKPSVADERIIEAGMKALEIPQWKKWAADCNNEQVDDQYLCAAIMMHTKNLKTLCLEERPNDDDIPPWLEVLKSSVCGNSFGLVHNFSNLKLIMLTLGPALKLRNLLYLFGLPALEKMALIHLIETDFTPAIPWSILSHPSPIQELTLLDSYIHTTILAKLIKSCATLKKFFLIQSSNARYLLNIPVDEEAPEIYLDYDKLTKALSQHGATLEHIRIEEEINNFRGGIDDRPTKTLVRSFVDMPNLKCLNLPLTALVDANDPDRSGEVAAAKLPPTLTALVINSVYMEQDESLISILRHAVARIRQGHLPHIRRVTCHATRFCDQDFLNTVEERFTQEFEEVKVPFIMERDPFDPDDDPQFLDDDEEIEFDGEDVEWSEEEDELERAWHVPMYN